MWATFLPIYMYMYMMMAQNDGNQKVQVQQVETTPVFEDKDLLKRIKQMH